MCALRHTWSTEMSGQVAAYITLYTNMVSSLGPAAKFGPLVLGFPPTVLGKS